MPRVSVVIPVFNKEKYVLDAIHSVLNQTFQDIEIIVIDDCSTDSSYNLVKKLNHPKIKLFRNEINLGTAKTGNRLIELATGEFIVRLDADDLMVPDRVSSQIDFMEQYPELTVSSGSLKCFGQLDEVWDLEEKHEVLWSRVLFKSPIIQGASIIRKSHWNKFNFHYDENSPNLGEDWLLWFRIAKKSKVGNLKKVLIHYRMEGQNITSGRDENYYQAREYLYSEMLRDLGLPLDYLDVHILTKPEFKGAVERIHIKRFFEWMNLLLDFNRSNGIFDSDLFEDEIRQRKNQLFFYLMKNNRKLLRSFFYYNRGLNMRQYRFYLSSVVKGK